MYLAILWIMVFAFNMPKSSKQAAISSFMNLHGGNNHDIPSGIPLHARFSAPLYFSSYLYIFIIFRVHSQKYINNTLTDYRFSIRLFATISLAKIYTNGITY